MIIFVGESLEQVSTARTITWRMNDVVQVKGMISYSLFFLWGGGGNHIFKRNINIVIAFILKQLLSSFYEKVRILFEF